MKSLKASLIVSLRANDVVVAEIEDAGLWQRVLSAMGNVDRLDSSKSTPQPWLDAKSSHEPSLIDDITDVTSPLERLANQLSIDRSQVEEASAPRTETPSMDLNSHCWEMLVSQRPGVSIPRIVVPATLLALWFRQAGLGNPTQAQAQALVKAMGIEDHNPSRGIRNSSWLQARPGGQVVINPAEISKAIKLGTCFCSKDWHSWNDSKQ